LYSNDIITKQKVFIAQLTPAEHCAQEYEQYLVEMRHLAFVSLNIILETNLSIIHVFVPVMS
jgi:hypothetical protein